MNLSPYVFFPARRCRARWLCALAAAVVAAGLLAGCKATKGQDTGFQPLATTNTDFETPVTLKLGNYPYALDTVDSGGVLDRIVVANRYSNDLSVVQHSAGTLSLVATLALPDGDYEPATVRWFDLDGDGTRSDIAVMHSGYRKLTVYQDTGSGTAWTIYATYDLGATAAYMNALEVGNGPGDELVATVPTLNTIQVLVNAPAGTLTEATPIVTTDTVGAPGGPGTFVVDDFDGDATVDLAILHRGANAIGLWSGDGSGNFAWTSTSLVRTNPTNLVEGEFTGDSSPDLAISTLDGIGAQVLQNDGSGSFTEHIFMGVPKYPDRMIVGTFDGDAIDDLLVLIPDDRLVSFLGSALGFARTDMYSNDGPQDGVSGTFSATPGLDAIVAERDDRSLSIFDGDGNGNFTRTVIGFETRPTFPTRVNAVPGGGDDLLLLQPFEDRIALLVNKP